MGDKDFFLSPDDAQTMGDINYMRTSKRTRRTFPKTLKNPNGFAIENEVSAMEDRSGMYKNNNNNQNIAVNTLFNPTPSTQSQPGITGGSAVNQTNSVQPEAPAPQARRKSDSSMDMFRNMAKNIRR
ncbi:hypothetical protein I4641_05335 [Waterburya agarophytonicola K14]|uniref:Uncharacterized protein n=1 Tax=Waterburya agarophytonicola KI4 TaxID=2874699 RepID=A0A964FGA3_9CYAN|nr:hypothetical protein [Waterburya agarophytonicola]MCC0176399.1 hypothetical protein [Waterburya agarophytonicola KI4]